MCLDWNTSIQFNICLLVVYNTIYQWRSWVSLFILCSVLSQKRTVLLVRTQQKRHYQGCNGRKKNSTFFSHRWNDQLSSLGSRSVFSLCAFIGTYFSTSWLLLKHTYLFVDFCEVTWANVKQITEHLFWWWCGALWNQHFVRIVYNFLKWKLLLFF